MSKICYVPKRFRPATLKVIAQADAILAEYARYAITLRTLYYQFVARKLSQNRQKEYKHLGRTIRDARRAGLIDWDAIEDRVRIVEQLPTWEGPDELLRDAAEQYRVDLWATQPVRPEVWIEKNALVGIIDPICRELRVPYLACVGYLSDTAAWEAGCRMSRYRDEGQEPLIIYLGDHDPSGLDMTRDIEERVALFARKPVEVVRIALNLDQVQQYELPPNFAKESDRRYRDYQREFGDECWELDALAPDVIEDLIREAVLSVRDEDARDTALEAEKAERSALNLISSRCGELIDNWDAVSLVLDDAV